MKNKNKIRGSEAVIQCLLEEGVDTLFGYVGGAIMPIYDSLYDYSEMIKHILTRHEQGAVHAAQGYARASGKIGVCFATSGPGATNLITGLADAQLDSTPLVCITGQVSSGLLGSDAFQEQDVISISIPVTKWNYQITKPEEIASVLAKAFYIARSGRPGPVLVDITKDVQLSMLEFEYKKCTKLRSYLSYPKISLGDIDAAAEMINEAKKPLILAGQGIILAKAQEELLRLAEKCEIPVACTLLGLSSIPTEHHLNMGMLGMHGNYAPNILTNECDLLIALGMRFDDRVTGDLNRYAKQAKIIHIDIDKAELGKNVNPDIGIVADVKEALSNLIYKVKMKEHTEWINHFRELYQVEYDKIIKRQTLPENGNVQMGEVIRIISDYSKEGAVVLTDVGQHQMKTARYFNFKSGDRFISSGGLGTMGFGLPAAIGAQIALPGHQVVVFIGDGGFQMTLQELATIFQNKLPVKIVILNNKYLGMVRQWQEMFFNKRYSFTELINPDFVAIAKAYSIRAMKVSKRDELNNILEDFINSKEAFLLDIDVEEEENVLPMVPAGDSVSNIRLE